MWFNGAWRHKWRYPKKTYLVCLCNEDFPDGWRACTVLGDFDANSFRCKSDTLAAFQDLWKEHGQPMTPVYKYGLRGASIVISDDGSDGVARPKPKKGMRLPAWFVLGIERR